VSDTHYWYHCARKPIRKSFQAIALTLVVTMFAMISPSPASVPHISALRLVDSASVLDAHAMAHESSRVASRAASRPVVDPSRPTSSVNQVALTARVQPLAFDVNPTPTDSYVISLIHNAFPQRAWHDAAVIAWCESKFHANDIAFDSNGTHDRGLFQLNDGGTAQYLFRMLGYDPNNVGLAFNPVLNVRAAALLYARDGWSQWSCASALA
jgi:hypothetical protein